MNNYPLGAENDPNAPWNQPESEEHLVDVTVSITLSKDFQIRVTDGCDLKEAAREQLYLPDEAFEYVNSGRVKTDLKDWIVDDFEVI